MSMSIIACRCPSSYQDKKLGSGRRFANPLSARKAKGEARCTGCGTSKLTLHAERALKRHAISVAAKAAKAEKAEKKKA